MAQRFATLPFFLGGIDLGGKAVAKSSLRYVCMVLRVHW